MNALTVTLFVSLVLSVGAVLLFVWAVKGGEPDYVERLALLPLDDDAVPRPEVLPDNREEMAP